MKTSIRVFGALLLLEVFAGCQGAGLRDTINSTVNSTTNGSTPAAMPTFTPGAGTYSSDTNVTINDSTPGATIYYTVTPGTTGTTPTTSSSTSLPVVVAGSGTTVTIEAIAVKSGMTYSAVAAATFVINYDQVSTPQIAPAQGTYVTDQTVTVTDSTNGATIYYTTDGTTPTTASPVYPTAGISVTGPSTTETIEVIAAKTGMASSNVQSATYTVLYQYSLSVSVNNASLGSITAPTSNPTTVSHGAATTIVAAPNTGYQFVNWTVVTGSGITFGNATIASTTVTLTGGNASIQANFAITKYSLAVTPGSGGTITTPASSPVTVNYGAASTIVATPNTGYHFVNWTVVTGSGASIGNAGNASTTAILTGGNATIQANFAITQYSLAVTPGSGGTITIPASSPVTVNYGAATTIVATPSAGYQFVNWTVTSGSGVTFGNANSSSTTVTLTVGNATIQANFALIQYVLTVNSDGYGTTTPAGANTVNYGAATPINASVNYGRYFQSWQVVSGSPAIADATTASTTATLTSGSATIKAVSGTGFKVIINNGSAAFTPASPYINNPYYQTFTLTYTSSSTQGLSVWYVDSWMVTGGACTFGTSTTSGTTTTTTVTITSVDSTGTITLTSHWTKL